MTCSKSHFVWSKLPLVAWSWLMSSAKELMRAVCYHWWHLYSTNFIEIKLTDFRWHWSRLWDLWAPAQSWKCTESSCRHSFPWDFREWISCITPKTTIGTYGGQSMRRAKRDGGSGYIPLQVCFKEPVNFHERKLTFEKLLCGKKQ